MHTYLIFFGLLDNTRQHPVSLYMVRAFLYKTKKKALKRYSQSFSPLYLFPQPKKEKQSNDNYK
jgi:hypothetical protein